MNVLQSMLTTKELPKYLWGEVVPTIVYILNRCPSKIIWGYLRRSLVQQLARCESSKSVWIYMLQTRAWEFKKEARWHRRADDIVRILPKWWLEVV